MDAEGNIPRAGASSEVELARPNFAFASPPESPTSADRREMSLARLFFSCTVIGGIQYGWALQLSLLTPFSQSLGVSHQLSSVVWFCGPIAGLVVQPCVGVWSDRCRSKLGRRRPFVLYGCIAICIAVCLVAFSSDIGYALGDTKEDCSVYEGTRPKAIIVYVFGFWLLDFSNNTVQGPARALMAELSGHHGTSAANAIFCLWMALGSILGYASGASGLWSRWFPFLFTKACCKDCADLKGAFLFTVVLVIVCLTITMIVAKEVPLPDSSMGHQSKGGNMHNDKEKVGLISIFKNVKELPRGMPSVLLVTALTWLSWFQFNLFDTDWMGREIYYGKPKGTQAEENAYNRGVKEGAFGLLLNAIVLGVVSFVMEPLCRKLTTRIVWVIGNFILAAGMLASTILTVWSTNEYHGILQPDGRVKSLALAIFAVFGMPLAVLYSIPFAVTAQLAANEGKGQGKCTGILNVSIVIPQMILSVGAGSFDRLFSKKPTNLPTFVFGAIVAVIAGICGILMLPKLSSSNFKAVAGGGH